MKMKKMFAVVLAAAVVMSFAACGSKSAGDDGQNPVMNYVGFYVCGRASILIGATDEKNGANAMVTWSSSAAENSVWEMSGTFDADTLTFEYSDCVRTDYVYEASGDVKEQNEVYKDGTGTMTFSDEDGKLTLTWKDDKENIAEDMVFEYSQTPAEGDEPTANAVNPWHKADSLAEAAEKAGLDGFEVPEGTEISLGNLNAELYQYMDGIAEIRIPVAAVEMTMRKGRADAAAEPGDISGDYTEYAHSWTQNVKGLEISCFGNREGEATKTIWQSGDYCYSILAQGAGGDDDFGLSADDISTLVNGIQ